MTGIPRFTAKASIAQGRLQFVGKSAPPTSSGVQPAACTTHVSSDGIVTYMTQKCCYSDPLFGYLGCHTVYSTIYSPPGR